MPGYKDISLRQIALNKGCLSLVGTSLRQIPLKNGPIYNRDPSMPTSLNEYIAMKNGNPVTTDTYLKEAPSRLTLS